MDSREMTGAELIETTLFKYHKPSAETIPKYDAINEAAKALALAIDANCPPGADRTYAMRLVQSARMTANSAIANNGAAYR